MTGFVFRVTGESLPAHIVGTLLAQRCRGAGVQVRIESAQGSPPDGDVLLRPAFTRFHAEIGLYAKALHRIGARPSFGARLPVHGQVDQLMIPFGPYGLVRGGVEFHQHWLRARALGFSGHISEYSPSLALARQAAPVSLLQAERMPLQSGVTVDAANYASLLAQIARGFGASIGEPGPELAGDLTFDCGVGYSTSRWHGDQIEVACQSRFPGIGMSTTLEAVRRWLALSARPSESVAEQREFNRLSAAEAERIADMEMLLSAPDPAESGSQALKRKIAVFSACGRIPSEDYEVFAPHEWLASLLARGISPRRHDRLADGLGEHELLAWLELLRRQLSPLGAAA